MKHGKDDREKRSKMKYKQYKAAVKYDPIHIVIMIFSLFFAAALIGGEIWRENNYNKHIAAEFVAVEGEIAEYKEFTNSEFTYYAIYYQYISPDGKIHKGFWNNDIYSEADAQAKIGEKVPLYYDKEFGVKKTVDEIENIKDIEKPDHIPGGVVIAICAAVFLNSLVKTVLYKANTKKN